MAVESKVTPAAWTLPGLTLVGPVLAAAGILAAHFALAAPWDVLALVFLAIPVAFASMNDRRLAVFVILAPDVALADNLIDADTSGLIAEIAVIAAISLRGARLFHLTAEERAEHHRVALGTAQWTARLKDQSGYWQAVAKTRMGVYATCLEERFILETMRQRPGAIVLDVGSASGRLEHALAEYAGHLIATDIDHDEIYARTANALVTPVVVSKLPGLPLQDGCAEVVSAIEVPAASDEKWFRAECARVLAPDGCVIVTAFNARSYKGIVTRILLRRRYPWSDLYYQKSLSQQVDLWREAGFEVVRKRGFYWSPLPRNSDSGWVAGWAALERLLGLRALTSLSPWVMLELRKQDRAECA